MCDLKDALQRGNAPQVLDVRTPREWDSGHIEGARHIPLAKLAGDLNQLHKGASLAVICGSGYRSSIAASLLLARGFAGVQNVMSGGFGVQTDGLSIHSTSVVIAFKVFGLGRSLAGISY